VAESFGTDVERYDRVRPRYPDAMVDRIVAALPGPEVLDVGCGTGIAARQFQAGGCRVLGASPTRGWPEFARRSGVPVEVAAFEAWEAAGRAFDAVVAGQAWHWVDPVAGAAKAAHVLRPGGRLAAFWHACEPPPEVRQAFLAAYRRVMPDSPLSRQAGPDQTPDGTRCCSPGPPTGSDRWVGSATRSSGESTGTGSYTRDEWLDQLPTSGALTRLPPEQLARVLDGVGTTIDAMGGRFTMPYTTVAVTAARTGAP
jgi:SAM-dependent methyltransferase